MSEPTITVAVDATNPGQFFACCGLLELADRLWPQTDGRMSAEAWFAAGAFNIACGGNLRELFTALAKTEIHSSLTDQGLKRLGTLLSANKSKLTPTDAEDKERLSAMWKVERLHISKPFDLWTDWWWDETTGGKSLKTWAAKQLVLELARGMLKSVQSSAWVNSVDRDCLTGQMYADALPFNFDAALTGQGSARDAGFSLYDLRTAMPTRTPLRPLVELAAFIGLQRFRPMEARSDDGDKLLRYSTWSEPLAVSVAAAASGGALELPGQVHYEFRLFYRSQYMKAFLPAKPIRGHAR